MKICHRLPPSPLPKRFAPKDTETSWIIKFWFQGLARAAGSMLCLGLYSRKMLSKSCALGGFCQEVTVFYWSAWTRGKPGSRCHTERQVRVCPWALSLVPGKGASSAWGPLLDGAGSTAVGFIPAGEEMEASRLSWRSELQGQEKWEAAPRREVRTASSLRLWPWDCLCSYQKCPSLLKDKIWKFYEQTTLCITHCN